MKLWGLGLWLSGIVWAAGVSADVRATGDATEALEQISHQIAYINTFGRWQEGAMTGVYRVILMDANEDYPHSKIYLQWVQQSVTDDQASIVAIAPIAEINNVGAYKLSVPRIVQSQEGFVVELTAINQYSRAVQNIQLLPKQAGQYRFKYVSTPYTEQVNAAVNKIPLKLDYYVRPTF